MQQARLLRTTSHIRPQGTTEDTSIMLKIEETRNSEALAVLAGGQGGGEGREEGGKGREGETAEHGSRPRARSKIPFRPREAPWRPCSGT